MRIGTRLLKSSSLQVPPANEMPRIAVERGAKLILANRGAPPLDRASRPRIYDGLLNLGNDRDRRRAAGDRRRSAIVRTMLRLLVLVAIAACADGKRAMKQDDAPTCSTMAECNARDGQRVHVIGVYTVYDPMSSRTKDMPPPRQVEVRLAHDSDGPFLGEVGHDDHFRPLDEIARLAGKRVRVTGTFHLTTPPDPETNPKEAAVSPPYIHPIERLAVE